MSDEPDRVDFAQWILERNLSWIAAAEVKTGVIVALNTTMLGALAAVYGAEAASDRTFWAILFSTIAAGCLGVAVFSAAMSVLPRTTGPASSFIFFGRIAETAKAEYEKEFRNATREQFLDDCLAQIHRNAEIARDKFNWVRLSMVWSFASVLPWILALVSLIGD